MTAARPHTSPEIRVRRAVLLDLERVAQLFDQYRRFYDQPADLELARDFLSQRLRRSESVILVGARGEQPPAGFVQLYPTFCSVSAAPIYVLYDLYVEPSARRDGIARALLQAAAAHAREAGAVRLELATARTNHIAQALYEARGWVRDEEFHRYSLVVR